MKDKLGITLSGLCVCHCLSLPLLAAFGASFSILGSEESEWLHKSLILPIIVVAFWSIYPAVKQHNFYKSSYFILPGLVFLLGAFLVPHEQEQLFTVIGAILLSYGHWINFQHIKQCNSEKL